MFIKVGIIFFIGNFFSVFLFFMINNWYILMTVWSCWFLLLVCSFWRSCWVLEFLREKKILFLILKVEEINGLVFNNIIFLEDFNFVFGSYVR